MDTLPPHSTTLDTLQEPVKPIPAFYCNYLLRSAVRHASLYIGSTPNPARRLAQHNGLRQGGANKTKRNNLRPWEMTLVVSGFTSRVGALQFEWAWQHTDNSRHAEDDDPTGGESDTYICPHSGQLSKRQSTRRGASLTAIISRLHLLLRSKYFSTWPLEVRFFSPDVHRVWQQWSSRVDGLLPDSIKVVADSTPENYSAADRSSSIDGTGTVDGLDVSNKHLKRYREKATFLLGDGGHLGCGVCKKQLRLEDDLIVVCSHETCNCASHITCLSTTFLQKGRARDNIIPTNGVCPACKSTIEWSTLMREVTLRLRGQNTRKRYHGTVRDTQAAHIEEDDVYIISDEESNSLNSCERPVDLASEEEQSHGNRSSKTYNARGSDDVRWSRDPYVEDKENINIEDGKAIPKGIVNGGDWDSVVVVD